MQWQRVSGVIGIKEVRGKSMLKGTHLALCSGNSKEAGGGEQEEDSNSWWALGYTDMHLGNNSLFVGEEPR